jgi:hypothetical protein
VPALEFQELSSRSDVCRPLLFSLAYLILSVIAHYVIPLIADRALIITFSLCFIAVNVDFFILFCIDRGSVSMLCCQITINKSILRWIVTFGNYLVQLAH